MSNPERGRFIHDALIHHGFTAGGATKALEKFVDQTLSDHDRAETDRIETAVRLDRLSDTVNELLTVEAEEPSLWDGDADETSILIDFLRWLPDMVRHNEAEKIREATLKTHGKRSTWAGSYAGDAALAAADLIDPFRYDDRYHFWVRISDGEIVPDRVARGI